MIFEDLISARPALPTHAPLMGLDLGTKTIGIAFSDILWTIASPGTTLKRKKFTLDAAHLLSEAQNRSVGGIILGLPKNMDGTEGPRSQATRAFARNLSGLTDLPVVMWDERLSTVAAERALLEADMSRKRRAEVIDSVAAGFILQGALDFLNQHN